MSGFRRSWGADPAGNGRWEFRIWAPSCRQMGVLLGSDSHQMEKEADGWFRAELAASPGAEYYFTPPGGPHLPDPAARAQAGDVHGASVLVDPEAFDWQTRWQGRPWHETVLYELHVGTFSEEGTFDGVKARLDHLAALGVTAIELCPIAQFAGMRGWGYDGVLLYAPHIAYGGPEGLKRLIDAAHARGLMVFLDVVYNHFGPDGNYLGHYAPEFFHPERHTPWGGAIAYELDPVRRFFIENALFWLEEYRFDGLRLDAVDQIDDQSDEPILIEIADAVRAHDFGRLVHLTTEDDRNITRLIERDAEGAVRAYDGEWNDDWHHVAHVLATGESEGYYIDFVDDPAGHMAKALGTGFIQQGGPSPFRKGARRGEPSAHLPPTSFINFLQNHDQIGNRAFGERISTLAEPRAVEVLTSLLLLSPQIPLLFMGEEWGETRPFLFFTDFQGELADLVREGRRREFAHWSSFVDPEAREMIADPNDPETLEDSRLDWTAREREPGRARFALIQHLLAIRTREIMPRLDGITGNSGHAKRQGERGVRASWRMGNGAELRCVANLGVKLGPNPGTMLGGAGIDLELEGSEIFRLGDLTKNPWAIKVAIGTP